MSCKRLVCAWNICAFMLLFFFCSSPFGVRWKLIWDQLTHQWVPVRSTAFLLTQLAIRAVWRADTRPLEGFVCLLLLWDRDAGAPWADITQDALVGGRSGYMWKKALHGTRSHTCDPLLTCLHTLTHIAPSAPALQHVNIHSDKQTNTRSGSTLHTIEPNTW